LNNYLQQDPQKGCNCLYANKGTEAIIQVFTTDKHKKLREGTTAVNVL